MPALERASKTACIISVLLILALQLAVHPDMTWALAAVSLLACAGSAACAAYGSREAVVTVWAVVASLAPAAGRVIANREGPVVDVIWMAALAGALLPGMSWSGWTLPRGWRPLAGGWALTLALAWPLVVARETGFDPRVLQDFGAVNSWAVPPMTAPQVVGWTLYVVLAQLLGLLWLDWLLRRLNDQPAGLPLPVHGLWIGTTAASLVAVYQGTIDLDFLNAYQWIVLRRATGTMLDANAYGVCAALAGPFAFAVLRGRPWRYAHAAAALVLLVNLAGMWMTGSRTALLCGVIALAALGAAALRGAGAPARRLMLATGGGVAIVVVGLAIAANVIGPLRRLLEIPATPSAAIASFWDRAPYGPIALQMMREYPLSGVGPGAYAVLAPDYWHDSGLGPLPFDNAQNWWRHQASELGLLGGIPLFALAAAVGWRALAGRARPGVASITLITRASIVAVGLISLVGMPTQNPVVLLWFLMFLAVLLTTLTEPDIPLLARHTRTLWIAAAVLAVSSALVTFVLARGPLSVSARAVRWEREYVVGTYPPEATPEHGPFQWTRQHAHFIWPARSEWLLIRVWAQHPDMGVRPVRITLSTPCGPFFEKDFTTVEPALVAVPFPEGQRAIDASLHVSRAWRPASYGDEDQRVLGAGLRVEYSTTPGPDAAGRLTVKPPACLL